MNHRIRHVGIFINSFSSDEDARSVRLHIKSLGVNAFDSLEGIALHKSEDTFLFTDSPLTAMEAVKAGIGFAEYIGAGFRTKAGFTDSGAKKVNMPKMPPCPYAAELINSLSLTDIDRMLLRHLHLPWTILETKRCVIREMTLSDAVVLYEGDPFSNTETVREYIENQYRFFEYGIWLIEDKATGNAIGRAGVYNVETRTETGTETDTRTETDTDTEKETETEADTEEETGTKTKAAAETAADAQLGYGISSRYRNKGYAFEACSSILKYAEEQLGMKSFLIRTSAANRGSLRLLEKLSRKFDIRYQPLP